MGAQQGSVKIIGESTDLHAQGYFVYDSKKSGSGTVRTCASAAAHPLDLLVDGADFVACHHSACSRRAGARPCPAGGDGPAEARSARRRVGAAAPRVQSQIVDKGNDLWVIDADRVARDAGWATASTR